MADLLHGNLGIQVRSRTSSTKYGFAMAQVAIPREEVQNRNRSEDDNQNIFLQPDSVGTFLGQDEKSYTLEEYSFDNFNRPPQKKSLSKKLFSGLKKDSEKPWRYSKEPLKQPLLKCLLGKDDLYQEACMCFLAILEYMGDRPSKNKGMKMELIDKIFEPPLRSEILRDEIYCQLMKQLTDNRSEDSERCGWELMWLVTGSFIPSTNLQKELYNFLRSKTKNSIATDCVQRVQKTLRYGTRKYPPHQVEVEAIQNSCRHISHKVYFPDGTDQFFDVESSTTAKDFCHTIATKLKLMSHEGFSLFVNLPVEDKVISIPEKDFLFDFIRHLSDWIRESRPTLTGQPPTIQYKVWFMQKLWINVVPGKDKQADTIFHYHQELPNLLKGYHKCNIAEAATLAALIFKVKFGGNKSNLENIPELLKELVPKDLVEKRYPEDWTQDIVSNINRHGGTTKQDAKIEFLNIICKWPTFGSAFYEVKQKSEPSYPQMMMVAINTNGVNLIDPKSKDIFSTHPFTKISSWSSGNTYFYLTIGNLIRGQKLLLETSQGYNMDDMMTSYISLILNKMKETR